MTNQDSVTVKLSPEEMIVPWNYKVIYAINLKKELYTDIELLINEFIKYNTQLGEDIEFCNESNYSNLSVMMKIK